MEKCNHCQSEELVRVRLDAMGGVSASPVFEGSRTKLSTGAATYGMLCTKCGTISRMFIKEEFLTKFTPPSTKK